MVLAISIPQDDEKCGKIISTFEIRQEGCGDVPESLYEQTAV